MKVLFDTNVLLDAILAHVPFVENAAYLLVAKIASFLKVVSLYSLLFSLIYCGMGFNIV